MSDDDAARLGTRLGNYTLTEVIGRGGMGVVYRGEHVYIHKRVAVKVLHRRLFGDAEARRRFLREAQAASAVKHPNIVGVTDFGEEPDGTVFLVMDHLEGRPLDRVLRDDKTIDLFRSIVICSQVARAVGEAHRRGIVHRDLKPENIMLERRPERRQIVRLVTDERGTLEVVETMEGFDFVTVLDFGAAKVWAPDAVTPVSGVVIATPAYMAPETARAGLSDPRSDVYALGVIFYQMLTGTVPFQGDSAADIMMKHVLEPPQSPRARNPHVEITAEAERLIVRALAKNPDERHRSMDELFHDLQRCYGTVRFRRQDEAAADPVQLPVPIDSARRPIPLVRNKKSSPAPGASAGALPSTPLPPAASTPVPAKRATPIPLTKKKDRHRTLPFGPQIPSADGRSPDAAVEVDEDAPTGQHRTQPYAEPRPGAIDGRTPMPREGQ